MGITILPLVVSAESEQCPAIDCDCGSLPREAWIETCKAHELDIKANCVANGNTPADYCSLHGPSAKPLPLAMDFAETTVLVEEELSVKAAEIEALYKASFTDLASMKLKVSSLQFKEALALLKSLDSNADALFSLQRQVTTSWLVYENVGEATSAWRDYAGSSSDIAVKYFAYAEELWGKYSNTTNPAVKKAHKVMAFRLLRIAGKTFEMSAYAYAGADKNKNAAKTWSQASDVSKVILAAKQESGAAVSHINYYRYQTAARLHRASYYWAVEGKQNDALKTLTDARDISPMDELSELIALEESQEEDSVVDRLLQ